jgi:hypothetical protein
MAAIEIRDPLAWLAGLIEAEHGGDGVDVNAIDVELVEPVKALPIRKLCTSFRL